MFFIDTLGKSSAVDGIRLNLITRVAEIEWISGIRASYYVRRRDQLRFMAAHLMMDPDLSYGRFANWLKETNYA